MAHRSPTEPDPERYDVEAIGEVVLEDKVLVIRRITVYYRLAVPEARREPVNSAFLRAPRLRM